MQINKKKPLINLFSEKLIFVGGVKRGGKSFLCPIISSFDKTEVFMAESIAENVMYLKFLKMINHSSATYLFKYIYNERIYNLNIGRHLNKRLFDYTSITKNKNKEIYLEREKSSKEGDIKIQQIKNEQNSYPIMFHDILLDPDFVFKCFPYSKILFVERNPIDLILEWYKKKYYGQFYANPRNTTLSFNIKKKIQVPFWCLDHEKEFSKLKNNYEKTIFLIEKSYNIQKKNYLKFKNKYKKNLLLIKFETLVENTDLEIKKIEKFLNLKKTKYTKNEIKKQNGNRKNASINYANNRKTIFNNISSDYKKKLIEIEKMYFKK